MAAARLQADPNEASIVAALQCATAEVVDPRVHVVAKISRQSFAPLQC
jgi:hypothetical protein